MLSEKKGRVELFPGLGRFLVGLAAVAAGVGLFWSLAEGADFTQGYWLGLARYAAAAGVAFVVFAATLLFLRLLLLARDIEPTPPRNFEAAEIAQRAMRARIAPRILWLGGSGIFLLVIGSIIAFSVIAFKNPSIMNKIDVLLNGIFIATLPVFATWVGAVITFYFTNDAYRQAADIQREISGSPRSAPKVEEEMLPYENLTNKIEKKEDQIKNIQVTDILALMKDGVRSIIVFNLSNKAVYIVRKNLMTTEWLQKPTEGIATLKDYLELGDHANAADATSFSFVAKGATVEQARQRMGDEETVDVFVTATGQKTEPVLGWLPKNRLTA